MSPRLIMVASPHHGPPAPPSQEKRKNPGPPRDPRLPPKPKGQTVGSFKKGLRQLVEGINRNVKDTVR